MVRETTGTGENPVPSNNTSMTIGADRKVPSASSTPVLHLPPSTAGSSPVDRTEHVRSFRDVARRMPVSVNQFLPLAIAVRAAA
jgi:hypothetical protein